MPTDKQIAAGLRPILGQIVGRCHVSDSVEDVIKYAKSRLQKDAWESMHYQQKQVFLTLCWEIHHVNRELYQNVMGGTH